jgi:hypothetical protein
MSRFIIIQRKAYHDVTRSTHITEVPPSVTNAKPFGAAAFKSLFLVNNFKDEK